MAKKVVADKTAGKKTLKKVRSFNIDDRIYNGLMEILESSDAQITLSVLVDDFLKKLYVFLLESEGIIKKANSDISLSSVVYDCRELEYFGGPNEKNKRVWNLIWSYEASKKGMALWEYLKDYVPDEFEKMKEY